MNGENDMKNKHLLLSVCITLILVNNVIFHSMVSGNESVYLASTTANSKIPVEELRLLLKPLIKARAIALKTVVI